MHFHLWNTRGRCVTALNWEPHASMLAHDRNVRSRRFLTDSPVAFLITDLAFSAWVSLWTSCGCQTIGRMHVPITRTVASIAAIMATAPVTVTWQRTADQVGAALSSCPVGGRCRLCVIKIRLLWLMLKLCNLCSRCDVLLSLQLTA